MPRPALAATGTAPPWGWAIAGAFAGTLLALPLFAPARWVADALAGATRHQLLLTEARGTVWTGSARLLLTGGTGSQDRAALPGRVHWTLRPHGVGLRLQLAADCCTPDPLALRLVPRAGYLAFSVSDGRSRWPAALLAGLGTPWNTLQLDGALQMVTEGLSVEWSAGRLALRGRAQWLAQDMSSRLSTLRPMGSYRITLTGGDVPALSLETVGGDLLLSGRGQWVGGRLRFEGEASAAPEREAALSNLLNIIGRRSGARSIIRIG